MTKESVSTPAHVGETIRTALPDSPAKTFPATSSRTASASPIPNPRCVAAPLQRTVSAGNIAEQTVCVPAGSGFPESNPARRRRTAPSGSAPTGGATKTATAERGESGVETTTTALPDFPAGTGYASSRMECRVFKTKTVAWNSRAERVSAWTRALPTLGAWTLTDFPQGNAVIVRERQPPNAQALGRNWSAESLPGVRRIRGECT